MSLSRETVAERLRGPVTDGNVRLTASIVLDMLAEARDEGRLQQLEVSNAYVQQVRAAAEARGRAEAYDESIIAAQSECGDGEDCGEDDGCNHVRCRTARAIEDRIRQLRDTLAAAAPETET
jgi:hypothetical protein